MENNPYKNRNMMSQGMNRKAHFTHVILIAKKDNSPGKFPKSDT